MVIIEASSGPCVFIDSAPSMLSPSSICTSALASGPSPMPPYSFGTNGHHRPCARLLAQFAQHFLERLGVEFLFRRDTFVVHPLADFFADRLGLGGDFEIDRHGRFPRLGLLLVRLVGWHISATRQRQRQTKFKAPLVIPRACGVSSTPWRLL